MTRQTRPSDQIIMRNGRSCATLIHSTGRAESRIFWPSILRGIDRHFPAPCNVYFSFDDDGSEQLAMELQTALRGLRVPPTLIARRDGPITSSTNHSQWAASLLHDFRTVTEPWVFHFADDVVLPEAVNPWSIEAVLRVARDGGTGNVSLIHLANSSFPIWHGTADWNVAAARQYLVRVETPPARAYNTPTAAVSASASPHDSSVSASPHEPPSTLEFYRPWKSKRGFSRYVVSQQPCLFSRAAAIDLLRTVPRNTTPQEWEAHYNQIFHEAPVETVGLVSLLERALTVRYASADALQYVVDVGHAGGVRRGWGVCVWQHAAIQLGLSPVSIPIAKLPNATRWHSWSERVGSSRYNDSSYAFCRAPAVPPPPLTTSFAAAAAAHSTSYRETVAPSQLLSPCLTISTWNDAQRHCTVNRTIVTNKLGDCRAVALLPLAARPPGCDCGLDQYACYCRGKSTAGGADPSCKREQAHT